jgi:hypothetical protein
LSLGALTIPSSIFESEGNKPHAAINTLANATAQHTVTRLIDVVAFCMRCFDLIETIRAALGMSSNDGWKKDAREGGQFYFPFSICHFSFVIERIAIR